jgi:lipoprotein-releasing system ATP-binding protein
MAELAISVQGVSKSYGDQAARVSVLRHVDFSIAVGEFVAILGPSGSGKSTLLNLLGLMDRPDKGHIAVCGVNTQGLDDDGRARLRNERLGFIFQFDSLLPEFTILENTLMPTLIASARGLPGGKQSQKEALAILDSLGIGHLRDRFPAQTSGGERQRAAVARALIRNPAVILADEPTGNLDRVNGEKVFSDLRRLAREKGTAVVLVTHDEPAAKSADRILRMNDGTLT